MVTTIGKTISSPDALFRECIEHAGRAADSAAIATKHRNVVRLELYRAAVSYQELARSHHNWFVDQAKSVGGIDALLESWFRPLTVLGEDWRDLLRDVAEGMTEKDYLASTAGSWMRRHKLAQLIAVKAEEQEPPPKVSRELPVEEQLALLRVENDQLRRELGRYKKSNAGLRRVAAEQEKRIAELEAALNRISAGQAKPKKTT